MCVSVCVDKRWKMEENQREKKRRKEEERRQRESEGRERERFDRRGEIEREVRSYH